MQAVPYIDIAKEHDQHSIQDRSPLSLIIGDRGKWLAKSIHSYNLKTQGQFSLFLFFPGYFHIFFCGQRFVATTQPPPPPPGIHPWVHLTATLGLHYVHVSAWMQVPEWFLTFWGLYLYFSCVGDMWPQSAFHWHLHGMAWVSSWCQSLTQHLCTRQLMTTYIKVTLIFLETQHIHFKGE